MTLDPNAIREAVVSLGLWGDESRGILRRFGVILNNSPVPFLVGREMDFINSLGASAVGLAEKVLIDAAQWCANATFGGIMASDEWKGLIEPDIKTPQDRFKGLIGITNCLGWGHISDWTLDEAKQELTFTVDHSYYTDYWVKKYGKPNRPICYMWTGVAGGYMDLLYGSKVHEFTGEETTCAARDGGEKCVFVGRKLKKKFGLG